MSPFQIIDLSPGDEDRVRQVAQMMLDAFAEMAPGWLTSFDEALAEVRESFAPGRISRVAAVENGDVLGWVAGAPEYDGHVWELHPLAVRPDAQRQGVGRALVTDFERQVRERGGLTVMLGTDDEAGWTSLSDVDLYQNTWDHIKNIQNPGGHPFAFYQRLGYVITGVVPDANGTGKPDILMSKRVAPPEGTSGSRQPSE